MADPSREQLAPLEAQFNAHPAVQAFLSSPQKSVLDWMKVVSQATRETGIEMPHDYQPAVEGGRVTFKKKSFIQRNGWFLPAVAVGAPIVAGAALGGIGGAAVAGTGAGAGATGAAATGGGIAAHIGALTAAGTVGANLYGAYRSSNAARDAARTQSESADKTIALQRQMYDQQQQNLSPYRQLGQGSLANLGNFQSFAGVPGSFGAGVQRQYQRPLSPGYDAPANQMQPGGGLMGSLANPAGSRGGGQPPIDMVQLRSPDGEVRAVPRVQAPYYIGRGAVEVN